MQLFAFFALFLLASCAANKPVLLAPPRPAIAVEEVHVYATEPQHPYTNMALLRGDSGGKTRNQKVVEQFKAQAAELGANGIVLDLFHDQGWQARPHGYAGTTVSNYGTDFDLGLGLAIQAPKTYAEARAIWSENER